MKKIMTWAMAAILICGASVFTACSSNDDNPAEGGTPGIAMIAKNGQIDYWRQIETAFRDACREKGLEACYYATSGNNGYDEQQAAVAELRKLGSKALRGIIFSPCYGVNGESAEAEVAALARERGIPVIILDSPVSATGPLASCPYFGTDNTAAGKAMAEKVAADKVAVFAMTPGPAIERAEAFKALKPEAVVYQVADKCNDEVQAVLADFDDFVFFNGSPLLDVLPMLKAAGKRVYTFDAYGEFLDELITGSGSIKGIMAQNTFGMARKAVDAVLANTKQGEMVPTFYITGFNLDDPSVQPFLDFYGKQLPVIEGLSEKIIGKWMTAENNGQPLTSNDKNVTTFISASKATVSVSRSENEGAWNTEQEFDVAINGNKVTLTGHPDEHQTVVYDYDVTAINGNEFSASLKMTVTRDGNVVVSREGTVRLTKQTADYREAILGTWEGKVTSSEGSEFDDGETHRWEYKADGTYVYYEKDGDDWVPYATNTLNEYFVDGTLLCTRWIDNDEEFREWWEIASIKDGVMKWKALRQKEDGSTYTATFEMKKVE